jgi:hypothetical protein
MTDYMQKAREALAPCATWDEELTLIAHTLEALDTERAAHDATKADSFDRGWNAAIEEGQKALIEMKARADPWHVNVVRAAIRAISQLKKDTGHE